MTATQTAVRNLDGVELPLPGTYVLDPSHTHVGFAVRHMMVSKVRGRFADVEGAIVIAEDPLASSVEVTVDLASIDTRDEERDAHLRSPDFFDVENGGKMVFRSTGLTLGVDGDFRLDGELTVNGVTRPLSLGASFEGALIDPYGKRRIGFSARGEIDREDFGLTWNMAIETGGVVVGKKVKLEIEAEAVTDV
ncbi:MAG: polyisoprenoid-binding protein [Acidimicrobiia bacterium]|nr:polyisoprenoid-binding protein [Acidimicrobiia bacterium]